MCVDEITDYGCGHGSTIKTKICSRERATPHSCKEQTSKNLAETICVDCEQKEQQRVFQNNNPGASSRKAHQINTDSADEDDDLYNCVWCEHNPKSCKAGGCEICGRCKCCCGRGGCK